MKVVSIIILLSIIILTSCNNKDDRAESQYTDIAATTPEIQEFKINEILKPASIIIGDKYLCILHQERQDGDQIFVYDSETLEFKYKFAKRGSGPKETMALDVVRNMRGDSLYLIDQAKQILQIYQLQDDKPLFISETQLLVPTKQPLQEAYMINDSVMVFNTLENDLITYNLSQSSIIDQFNISSVIRNVDSDNQQNLGDFHFSYNNGDLYVTMRLIDQIFKIELDSDYMIYSQDVTPIESPTATNIDLIDMKRFHIYINAGNDYVMTQYYGYRLKDMQPFPINPDGQNLKYEFIIFDKNLTPLIKLHPSVNLLQGFFDEKRHRIYYLEAFEDFDKLKYISF